MAHHVPHTSIHYEITKKDDNTIKVTTIDWSADTRKFDEVTPNAAGVYDLKEYTANHLNYVVYLQGNQFFDICRAENKNSSCRHTSLSCSRATAKGRRNEMDRFSCSCQPNI